MMTRDEKKFKLMILKHYPRAYNLEGRGTHICLAKSMCVVELPQLHIAIYDGRNSRALQHHHAHQHHAAPYITKNATKVTVITPFPPYYT